MEKYIDVEGKERELLVETTSTTYKGVSVEAPELYYIDDYGDKVADAKLSSINDINFYDEFKKKKGLLSSKEIIKIREKYNLNQGEFADLLGVGKITIHRYEHTQVQTEAVDSMIRIANDPDVMYYMLVTNKDKLSSKKYDETLEIIQKLKNEDSHSLVDINRFENSFRIKTTDVDKVVNTLRNKYHSIIINSNDEMENDLSPIKLLKLIYYVQAITLKKTGKKAYNEDIEAWKHGPVVKEVYEKYKKYKSSGIPSAAIDKDMPKDLIVIIEEVVKTYGMLSTNKLIQLTHDEDPWKNTKEGDVITPESIKEYFDKIYDHSIKYR